MSGNESKGQLAGLTFPITDSIAAHSFVVTLPGHDMISLRRPYVPLRSGQALMVAVTGSSRDANGLSRTFPLVIMLSPTGVTAWPITTPQPGLISQISLTIDPEDNLNTVWSVVGNDGISSLYYAEGHLP